MSISSQAGAAPAEDETGDANRQAAAA